MYLHVQVHRAVRYNLTVEVCVCCAARAAYLPTAVANWPMPRDGRGAMGGAGVSPLRQWRLGGVTGVCTMLRPGACCFCGHLCGLCDTIAPVTVLPTAVPVLQLDERASQSLACMCVTVTDASAVTAMRVFIL